MSFTLVLYWFFMALSGLLIGYGWGKREYSWCWLGTFMAAAFLITQLVVSNLLS